MGLQGRKFDLRAYCLVARTAPHHLWLFHPGYCKVALEKYDASNFDNKFQHLTNACVQKSHPDYKASFRGAHIWSEAEAEVELLKTGQRAKDAPPLWTAIHHEMKQAIVSIFDASKDLLQRRNGYFDLLGFDFMIDDDFGLHLLEVNSNPAMFFDSSPTLEEMVPRLIGTSLDMVFKAQRPGSETSVPSFPAPFELVVDEAAGF